MLQKRHKVYESIEPEYRQFIQQAKTKSDKVKLFINVESSCEKGTRMDC